jgi:hypothetical protein
LPSTRAWHAGFWRCAGRICTGFPAHAELLYAIKVEIRGKPHQRRQVRQARTKPLIDDLEHWLRGMLEKLSRKSETSAALLYALNLWPALTGYCDDGMIQIDNSAAERALRGVAIARRNYFCSPVPTWAANALPRSAPNRDGQAERCRPRSLVAPCASPHRRSSRQPCGRISALALRRAAGSCLNNTPLPSGVKRSSGNSTGDLRRR